MSQSQKPVLIIDDSKTGTFGATDGNPALTNFFSYTGNFTVVSSTSASLNDFGTFSNTSQFGLATGNSSTAVDITFNGISTSVYFSVLNCANVDTCEMSVSTDGGGLGFERLAGFPTTDHLLVGSGKIPDGKHFLQLAFFDVGIAVDYALIELGTNSPFPDPRNTNLFVNHSDATILYDGQHWNESADGRSRDSNTPNDRIFFSFAGTDLTILGLVTQDAGNVTVGLTLDQRQEIQTPIFRQHPIDNYHVYFSLTSLNDTSVHNVTIQLHNVTGAQAFRFRGFTYTPNFASVADMPALPNPTSLRDQADQPTTTTTGIAGSTSTANSNNGGDKKVSGGEIAGAVIGALLGILLLALVVFWIIKRRRRRTTQSQLPEPTQADGPDIRETAFHPLPGYVLTPFIPDRSDTSSSLRSPRSKAAEGHNVPPSAASQSDFISTSPSESTAGAPSSASRDTSNVSPRMMEMIERMVHERVDAYNRPPEYEPS